MSDTHLQAIVGPDDGTQAVGSSSAVRKSRGGGLLTAPISARFQEAVLRGNVFGVASQAGVATQAGLSVTTPVLTLFNPGDSGVNCVLWFAGVQFTVVFAAVAAVFLAVNSDDSAAAGNLPNSKEGDDA